jgi:UDP-N-acetylglucosamine 1-carboxyvinyltransferase
LDKVVITGGNPLVGSVRVSGSKNGTLPLLAATLLVEGESIIENIPDIHDVTTMIEMLRRLGAKCTFLSPGVLKIDATHLNSVSAPYDLVRRMRGSFYVAGPLLARFGAAEVPLPGGCVIGSRPVDFHVRGFRALGAEVEERHGMMYAKATSLKGTRIYMDPRFRSVGATVNIMLAAALAEGTTAIENASREPEVVACQNFLVNCGADIQGVGSATVIVNGVKRLRGCRFESIPDRMEAGTFMYATAITGGDVTIDAVSPYHMDYVLDTLRQAGVELTIGPREVRVRAEGRTNPVDITTAPYPGFPTDLQPAHGVLAATATGTSIIEETIFDARYNYIDELIRMGAQVKIVDRAAIFKGVPKLYAAPVEASDIRAGAALILAGLAADGETEITGAEFLDRGYENIEAKLSALGARIARQGTRRSEEAICWA